MRADGRRRTAREAIGEAGFLPSSSGSEGPEREVVDLLFFPTGGGKTEAYLGLAAFAMVLRRLRNPGARVGRASRADALHAAAADARPARRAPRRSSARWSWSGRRTSSGSGAWPFEIGLWVGKAATPNRMGQKGDNDRDYGAGEDASRSRTTTAKPSPIPLENCPWCGTRFEPDSFRCCPNADQPDGPAHRLRELRRATSRGDRPLPIVAVDEPIYRRLPCFLIATVDKFAALPWVGAGRARCFGWCDRYDKRRLLRAVRPGQGHAARRAAAAARPDHPGRAAPDLGAARHHGRALRDGDRGAVHARRSTARRDAAQDRRLDGHRAAGAGRRSRRCSARRVRRSSRRPGPTGATRSSPRRCRASRSAGPAVPRHRGAGAQPQGRAAADVPARCWAPPQRLYRDAGGHENQRRTRPTRT